MLFSHASTMESRRRRHVCSLASNFFAPRRARLVRSLRGLSTHHDPSRNLMTVDLWFIYAWVPYIRVTYDCASDCDGPFGADRAPVIRPPFLDIGSEVREVAAAAERLAAACDASSAIFCARCRLAADRDGGLLCLFATGVGVVTLARAPRAPRKACAICRPSRGPNGRTVTEDALT